MGVDDSFKRPGAVPFKWEIIPGVPKADPQRPPQTQKPQPPRLSPPPSGISFYPPHHSTLHVRVPSSRSKSGEHRRRIDGSRRLDSARSSGVAVVATGCFPVASPRRKIDKKIIPRFHDVKSEDCDVEDMSDLQTLARWSVSSQKSLSTAFSGSSSPWVSPFSTPQRAQDAEWAAYGLF